MARSVAGCAELMRALGLDGRGRSADVRAGGRLDGARRPARPRPGRGGGGAPAARPSTSTSRSRATSRPAFQAEAADVHRELFAEHADLYGENVRRKLELAFAVSDEAVAAARAEREAYRVRALEALEGFDVLLTPTMPMVAPPIGVGDLALRERMMSVTRPFSATGWPALALPCGPAEDGLPASLQIAARPGDDALVLAVGEAIERALAHPK